MATSFKILGQTAPTNSTTALIPAQGGSSQVVVSTITVANRNTSGVTDYFYIRVAAGNAAADNKQYVAYKVSIAAGAVATLTVGLTLGPTDVVYAYSDSGNCSFNAFGSVNS